MTLLREHQARGAEQVAERARALGGRFLLGDAPRVGKTRTLIRALELLDRRAPLVVCPANARTHWQREFEVMGWPTHCAAMVVSYDQIVRGGETMRHHLLTHLRRDSLILDEFHRVRTPTAKRTRLLLGTDSYARRLPVVLGASGTPIWKNSGNLWTVLASLFPGVVRKLGIRTYSDFMNRYCNYWIDEWGGYRVSSTKNDAELRGILDEVMLRRTLGDLGTDVPTLDWSMMLVDGDDIPDLPELEWVKARIANGEPLDGGDPELARFRRLVGEAKVAPVVEQLADELGADDGQKVVVFAHHHSVLNGIESALAQGLVRVDGSTSLNARDEAVFEFRSDPGCRVFLGQTQACMENLTLSAASRVIIVEPDYTANVNIQAASRVVNPNEASRCNCVQLVALANSLDEAIVRQNIREATMTGRILEASSEDISARAGLSGLRTR